MKFPRLFQLMNRQTNAQTDPLFESELCEGQKVSRFESETEVENQIIISELLNRRVKTVI